MKDERDFKDMNNDKPLISIVMPVFNAIEYISETVESIQAQTYKNFEVISIDDISTDGTYEYMWEVSAKDHRFFVKRRDKKGGTAAKAIEYSLPYCHGEYYFFMTHDDLLDDNFLEICVKKALETDADIVQPNLQFYYGKENIKKADIFPLNNDYSQILDNKKAFSLSLTWQIHDNSLQKMKLVRKIGFSSEYFNNCEFYARKRYFFANRIVFCNTNFYYRQNNPNAITKKIHYFTIDVLTTDILLFELLIEYEYPRNILKKRLFGICGTYAKFKYIYRKNKFDSEKHLYISNAFEQAKNKLLHYIKMEHYFVCLIPIYCHILYPVLRLYPTLRRKIIGILR
jgi:glycosyltransferase involved in cell wall biosynthesis